MYYACVHSVMLSHFCLKQVIVLFALLPSSGQWSYRPRMLTDLALATARLFASSPAPPQPWLTFPAAQRLPPLSPQWYDRSRLDRILCQQEPRLWSAARPRAASPPPLLGERGGDAWEHGQQLRVPGGQRRGGRLRAPWTPAARGPCFCRAGRDPRQQAARPSPASTARPRAPWTQEEEAERGRAGAGYAGRHSDTSGQVSGRFSGPGNEGSCGLL